MKRVIGLSLGLILIGLACKSKTKQNNLKGVNYVSESASRGLSIYNDMCINCHLENGKGVKHVFPPLSNSDFLRNNQTQSIKAIKFGLSGKIKVNGIAYNSVMTPMGLTNKEIADVMNYINTAWENNINNVVTPQMVSSIEN